MAGKVEVSEADVGEMALSVAPQDSVDYQWPSCGEGREDWIPCLDNEEAIRKLRSTKHYQHRERHCPSGEHMERCLPPLPKGYQQPIAWPKSRDRVRSQLESHLLSGTVVLLPLGNGSSRPAPCTSGHTA